MIPLISVNKRIEPLNSRTKDWRGTLSEDDKVEVQVGRLLSLYGKGNGCSKSKKDWSMNRNRKKNKFGDSFAQMHLTR